MSSRPPGKQARVDHLISLQRERERLRGERDRLLLDLCDDLGEDAVAGLFGVSECDAGRLRERARERLDAARPEFVPGVDTAVRARRIARRAPAALVAAARAQGAPPGPPHPAQGQTHPSAAPAWSDVDAYYEALGSRALERRPRR